MSSKVLGELSGGPNDFYRIVLYKIFFNQELQITVLEYLRIAGHEDDKDSFLFLPVKHAPGKSDKKRKLSRKTIDYLFKKYAKLAELDGVTPWKEPS